MTKTVNGTLEYYSDIFKSKAIAIEDCEGFITTVMGTAEEKYSKQIGCISGHPVKYEIFRNEGEYDWIMTPLSIYWTNDSGKMLKFERPVPHPVKAVFDTKAIVINQIDPTGDTIKAVLENNGVGYVRRGDLWQRCYWELGQNGELTWRPDLSEFMAVEDLIGKYGFSKEELTARIPAIELLSTIIELSRNIKDSEDIMRTVNESRHLQSTESRRYLNWIESLRDEQTSNRDQIARELRNCIVHVDSGTSYNPYRTEIGTIMLPRISDIVLIKNIIMNGLEGTFGVHLDSPFPVKFENDASFIQAKDAVYFPNWTVYGIVDGTIKIGTWEVDYMDLISGAEGMKINVHYRTSAAEDELKVAASYFSDMIYWGSSSKN